MPPRSRHRYDSKRPEALQVKSPDGTTRRRPARARSESPHGGDDAISRSPRGCLKHVEEKPKRKGLKQKVRRSISLNAVSNHSDYLGSSLSTLFQVNFPEDDNSLVQIQEFERIEEKYKDALWYVSKELKTLLSIEVDRNRKYADGELSQNEMDKMIAMDGGGETDLDELCCWRGLEHLLWDGEDRSVKIRKAVRGIVGWYQEAKDMGYHDPDELRVVSKSRTKSDRTKAQKRGSQDASYAKKAWDGNKQNGKKEKDKKDSSPKRMAKRLSGKFTSMPKLNWSPKPHKKTLSVTAA